MKKICFLLFATLVLAGFVNAQSKESNAKLRDVKKIYVGELGRSDDADIVREKSS